MRRTLLVCLLFTACEPAVEHADVNRIGGAGRGEADGPIGGRCSGLAPSAYCEAATPVPPQPPPPCGDDADCASGLCVAQLCACRGQQYGATPIDARPNVLVVLDRSGSMAGAKWTAARDAMVTLATTYGDRLRLGLELFSDPAGGPVCGTIPRVQVDVGDATAPAFVATVLGATPSGGTPMAEALRRPLLLPSLQDPTRDSFVVLVTDGEPTCADPRPIVSALAALPRPVRTFVVGFGSGVDPVMLNELALRGGTALPGPRAYLQADDRASLQAALDAIAGRIIDTTKPCRYALAGRPPDPARLAVSFDGVPIPADDGGAPAWRWDEARNELEFFGESCVALREGRVTELGLLQSCPNDGVEPPPCVPAASCPDAGASCGTAPDGCGGTLDCGACAGGQVCGVGRPNACG